MSISCACGSISPIPPNRNGHGRRRLRRPGGVAAVHVHFYVGNPSPSGPGVAFWNCLQMSGRRRKRGCAVTDAIRARRCRERHRNGRAVVAVEVDLELVSEFLVDARLLQLAQLEDRQAIGVALRDLIDVLIRRHA